VGRDVGDDMSGDQVVWNDLVARLELPIYVDPASAPWPARENLSGNQAQATPASADGAAPSVPDQALTSDLDRPDRSAAGGSAGSAGTPSGTRPGTGADRSRVIRPASFLPFAPESGTTKPPAIGADPLAAGNRADSDDGRNAKDMNFAEEVDYIDYLAYDDEDLDDRYIPPPIPPLPKLDPMIRGAWTALFGGPAYLFIATLLSWQVPGWAELAAIIAFVAGFTILVIRLGDGPSRRDGPDQGAVV
jgi:hypothetical protein